MCSADNDWAGVHDSPSLSEMAEAVRSQISSNDKHPAPCRLIGLRATKQIADARRRKLRKQAKKKGRTPSKKYKEIYDRRIK